MASFLANRLGSSSSFELNVVCFVSAMPLQQRSCSACILSSGWATTTGRLLVPKVEKQHYVSFPRTQRRATASGVERRFRHRRGRGDWE